MAQAKKKQSTKTAKKSTGAQKSRRQSCGKSCSRKQQTSNRDRNHVYAVTAMSLLAGILLCANAVILAIV